MCCNQYNLTSVAYSKHEFIVAGRGYNILSQIKCMHQFIYPFHISIVHVLYKYIVTFYFRCSQTIYSLSKGNISAGIK